MKWLWSFVLLACGGATAESGGGGASGDPPLEVTIEELELDRMRDSFAADEAQLLADDVIAHRRAGEHGSMPPLEQSEDEMEPDAWPTVTVQNGTPHGLVVWFSGPCPRTVALAPNGELIAEFCEGTYDIAAELSAPNFHPFVGEGDLLENGHSYSVRFYVIRRGRRPQGMRRR